MRCADRSGAVCTRLRGERAPRCPKRLLKRSHCLPQLADDPVRVQAMMDGGINVSFRLGTLASIHFMGSAQARVGTTTPAARCAPDTTLSCTTPPKVSYSASANCQRWPPRLQLRGRTARPSSHRLQRHRWPPRRRAGRGSLPECAQRRDGGDGAGLSSHDARRTLPVAARLERGVVMDHMYDH